jgi:site-specific DNA recombinase
MKIGFKGTMNALFLKGLALKTRRGLLGQVERGRMAGGLSYGYRVRSLGEWEIVPEDAAIVVRIYRLYAEGVSPITIAKLLNAEGIPGPDGCAWSPSTIHGHVGRGTGILNNELYVGVYVWPKQRFVKNPETGKRIARPVPDEGRGRYPRAHLRIIDDDLWGQVKRQQTAKRRTMTAGIGRGRKPAFLFSGLTKCGECGAGFIVHGRDELRCFNRTKRGTETWGGCWQQPQENATVRSLRLLSNVVAGARNRRYLQLWSGAA